MDIVFGAFLFKYVMDIVLVIWCMKKYGVPYAPSSMGMVKKMVGGLPLKSGMKIVELGSGDGRVSVEIVRRFKVEVVGVELNSWLLFWSRVRAAISIKKGKVRFIKKDLFKVSFKEVDGVYMYLLPVMIKKLLPRLERELKKGSLVMSFDYPMGESKRFELVQKIEGRRAMWIYRKR